jgi:hypothetical protein
MEGWWWWWVILMEELDEIFYFRSKEGVGVEVEEVLKGLVMLF